MVNDLHPPFDSFSLNFGVYVMCRNFSLFDKSDLDRGPTPSTCVRRKIETRLDVLVELFFERSMIQKMFNAPVVRTVCCLKKIDLLSIPQSEGKNVKTFRWDQ